MRKELLRRKEDGLCYDELDHKTVILGACLVQSCESQIEVIGSVCYKWKNWMLAGIDYA